MYYRRLYNYMLGRKAYHLRPPFIHHSPDTTRHYLLTCSVVASRAARVRARQVGARFLGENDGNHSKLAHMEVWRA